MGKQISYMTLNWGALDHVPQLMLLYECVYVYVSILYSTRDSTNVHVCTLEICTSSIIRSTKSSPYQDRHHSMLSSDLRHTPNRRWDGWVGVAIIATPIS